jgi:hypothetical protein
LEEIEVHARKMQECHKEVVKGDFNERSEDKRKTIMKDFIF